MEIATNSGHFGLAFEKKSGTEGNHLIIAMSLFLRSSVFKMSPVHTPRNPTFSNSSSLMDVFVTD